MSDDLDRRLRESLASVRSAYDQQRAPERERARACFDKRLKRKRWFFGIGVAVAAGSVASAALLVAYALAPNSPRAGVAGARNPAIRLSVRTDPHPDQIGVRHGRQWVGTSAGLQVFAAKRVRFVDDIDLGAAPSDLQLSDSAAWAALPSLGQVAQVDLKTHTVKRFEVGGGPASSMRISVGDNAVWIVVDSARLERLDLGTGRISTTGISDPIDVSARSSQAWVLTKRGVQRIDSATGRPVGGIIASPTASGDLFVKEGLIYLSSAEADQVVQFKGATRKFQGRFSVAGTYADLATSRRAIWVLSRKGDGSGLLTPIDPVSFQPLSSPVVLTGDPVRATADGRSVWVVERSAARLVRVDQATVLRNGAG